MLSNNKSQLKYIVKTIVRILIPIFLMLPKISNGQITDTTNIKKEIDSLLKISNDLIQIDSFEQALESSNIAEKLSSEAFGTESVSYGNCCYNLCSLFFFYGNYLEANKWCEKALVIRERVLGKENIDYSNSLNNLGVMYLEMGNLEKALAIFLEYKAIIENTLGKLHLDYASCLTNLGIVYRKMSNFKMAEPMYLSARDIREKLLGKDNPEYAKSLNGLAILYSAMGNNVKAEEFYMEYKIGIENSLGKENKEYGHCLTNVGSWFFEMGNYQKALPLFMEAKELSEKILGKAHPKYSTDLLNLGNVYYLMGNIKMAEVILLEAKETFEKNVELQNSDYSLILNTLSALYSDRGFYEGAIELLYIALRVNENKLGKMHPEYANILCNLGINYVELGNDVKGEQFFIEANEINKKVLGKDHPQTCFNYFNLAFLYERENRHMECDSLLNEYFTTTQMQVLNSTSILSEIELERYVSTFQSDGNDLLSSLLNRYTRNFEAGLFPTLCYNNVLFQKGFLLWMTHRRNILAHSSLEAEGVNDQLKSIQSLLAEELVKPLDEQNEVEVLSEKVNSLEKSLARSVPGYATATQQVKWQEVQSSLQKNEASIEFVNFKVSLSKMSNSIIYAALLVKPGLEKPMFIKLFEENELKKVLSQKMDHANSEFIAQIYTRGASPISRVNSLQGLYNICWKPLDSLLSGIKRIYYSPVGLLHQINFDAIPVNNDQTLTDWYHLIRLGSTRSLVVTEKTNVNTSNDVVLYGGIQYEKDTTQLKVDTIPELIKSTTSEISFAYTDRSASQRGSNWNYLPGTEKEVKEIASITKKSKYPNQIFQGKFATEESFKNLSKGKESPRVIHLATHGFFFPDIKDTTQHSNSLGEQPAFKISDHPMIRSGLLLSGANLAWKTGKPWKEGMEDGILTAYEISQMNLSNTELVVLSACETGLGDIQGNEGVYGLQRAFKIAGVKYLIMSLWQIPDEETKEFMISFYKNWLNKKMAIPDAFRITQKEMQKRYTNPYLWAGFVLVE